MAVSGFAMSAAIFIAGGGSPSLNALLQNRLGRPAAAGPHGQ